MSDQPAKDGRFHDMVAQGLPEDPWNEVVLGLWVGSSEVEYPRNEFDAVLSVFDWHFDRTGWLPPPGTPHLVLPLYDSKDIPIKSELKLASDFIHLYHKDARPVLIRCQAGLNRSSLVTAVYMCEHLGFSGIQAIKAIKSVREGALFNRYFRQYLIDTYKPWETT